MKHAIFNSITGKIKDWDIEISADEKWQSSDVWKQKYDDTIACLYNE